jgi:hypothetical protein
MAERVGFEPTCRLPDKTLSRRPRYDHFGTSPVVRRTGGPSSRRAVCRPPSTFDVEHLIIPSLLRRAERPHQAGLKTRDYVLAAGLKTRNHVLVA